MRAARNRRRDVDRQTGVTGGASWRRPGGPLALVVALVLGASAVGREGTGAAAREPVLDDGSGAYATGTYRNLFVEAGHSPEDVATRISRAYQQLFHGDPETERLFFPSGENENGPLAYIPDIQHDDVRSEGMSYGMMITVQLDKKAEFDALWNWSVTHMYQGDPTHPSHGFFSWNMAYDGTVRDELPAPDGEEYYVMALYFAANRWGNGEGIYDYAAWADRILDAMVHREPITGPVRQPWGIREHTVGKEVNEEHNMILFSPDERNTFSDVSYHLPAFYELWARWGPERDRAFWTRAAEVSRDYFVKAAHPETGLAPNLAEFDGTPRGFRGTGSGAFREDAWRVALNWSADWSWWAKEPRERELSDRIQAFFESQGMETYGDNWHLDGRVIRDRHSPGLVATNGVASLAATNEERAARFTEALWNLEIPSSRVFRYYDGLLYVMSLLHAAGEFRIILPPAGRARTDAPASGVVEDGFALPATDDGLPGKGPIRRYPWFQDLWRERRSNWAARVEEDRGAVVFLGDSITQGWGEGLGAAFPGLKVANRGISGDTTRGVLIRLEEDVLALEPAAVVLLIGTNDLEEAATPEVVAGNLQLLVEALEAHDAHMPIVLCQVFPSSPEKKRPPEQIQAVNALYLAAVKNDPQVTYLETWPLFADENGNAKVGEFPDLLHPNEAGYAKWAAALRPVLATLGFSEREPEPFAPEEGFESLFNGHDLTGWGYRPTSEEDKEAARSWQASDPDAAEWPFVTERIDFDGLTASPDGRFVVIGGRLVVTTPPEHRKIQQLWTTREFPEDFVLKLEFRATPNADSGIYLRGPQLQCRDYALAGPWKDLERYRPQEWNEIVVEVKNGVARATCNGEVLESAMDLPLSGPIGLEGDRGQMEYRRIRIRAMSR